MSRILNWLQKDVKDWEKGRQKANKQRQRDGKADSKEKIILLLKFF